MTNQAGDEMRCDDEEELLTQHSTNIGISCPKLLKTLSGMSRNMYLLGGKDTSPKAPLHTRAHIENSNLPIIGSWK
jgi:hypothetical protein